MIGLELLSLQNNSISVLKENTFAGAPNLYGLFLTNNKIEVIENDALDLPFLLQLFLANNMLRTLADNTFLGTPYVIHLFLEGNFLSQIGQSLYHLQNLDILRLGDNPIEDIYLLAFARMPALRQLQLKATGFHFRENVLSTPANVNSSVGLLDLSRNNLTNSDVLKQLEKIGFGNLSHL